MLINLDLRRSAKQHEWDFYMKHNTVRWHWRTRTTPKPANLDLRRSLEEYELDFNTGTRGHARSQRK